MEFGKSLINNTLYRLLNIAAVLLTTILLTRMLGASDFGVLTLMITNASILNLISSFGISSGITYNIATMNISIQKILTVTLFLLVAQFFFASIVEFGWFYVSESFLLFKGENGIGFLLGISFFISISLIEKYSAFYNGRQQYLLASYIAFYSNFVLLLLLATLFWLEIGNNLLYFKVYIAGNFLQAIAFVLIYHLTYKEPISITVFSRREFKLFFSYSFLAFITNCLQFIAYRADYWLVDYYKGTTELGLYSVAVRLSQLFWIVPNLFASVLFPVIAGNRTSEGGRNILSVIRMMNAINIFAGVILIFFSPYLIVRVFGQEYIGSIVPFQILLPGAIFFCITTVLAAYFSGVNKLTVNFRGTMICLFVILAIDIALIPYFGIIGAAIASSIGYAFATIYSIIVFKKQTEVSFKKLLVLNKEDLIYLKGLVQRTTKA